MQQGNFIDVFLARHVSGTYANHQEHQTSCRIWFSALGFWMGGGLESLCVGHVYGVDGTVRRTVTSSPYTAALKNTTHPKTRCRKPICCNSKSNAPDDGRMYPKHVELRIHQ